MQVQNQVTQQPLQSTTPVENKQPQTTLDKAIHAVKENTADGTFIGDNMLLTGAGGLVGTVATGAAIAKTADAIPAVGKALEFTFVDNGRLVGAGLAGGAAYVLGEDAIESFKEGSYIKGGLEATGAVAAGLAATELVGDQYNIPVMKDAFSTPARKTVEFVKNNDKLIAGAALAVGASVAVDKGLDLINEGHSVGGGALLTRC